MVTQNVIVIYHADCIVGQGIGFEIVGRTGTARGDAVCKQ
jgi:hypothetical protein